MLTREGHIPGGSVCLIPPSTSQPHRETKRAAGKRARVTPPSGIEHALC